MNCQKVSVIHLKNEATKTFDNGNEELSYPGDAGLGF